MSFLEALTEYLSGNKPDLIIFNVVNQLLYNFKLFEKKKNPNISDLRFEQLEYLTYEKLIKEGFKSVCANSLNDEDAKERVSYLIRQYYNDQYLKSNPKIQQLNDDVKEILNQFSAYFPQFGKSKFTYRKIITLSDDFDISYFSGFAFSKNEPRKSRLEKLFFAMYEILLTKKSLDYSDLINELKSKLGVFDNEEITLSEPKNNNANEVKAEEGYNAEEFEHDNIHDTEDGFSADGNENLSKIGDFEYISILLSSELENELFSDSNIIVITLNQFINLCTERQRIIFGVYLLKENAAINNSQFSELLSDTFKGLAKLLKISQATLYNDKSKAFGNLTYVIKKNELNDSEKQTLIRKFIIHFEDYFKENGIL